MNRQERKLPLRFLGDYKLQSAAGRQWSPRNRHQIAVNAGVEGTVIDLLSRCMCPSAQP